MHEKTGRLALIDQILDHPANRGRDPHEMRALRQKLEAMKYNDLLLALRYAGS